MYDMNDDRPDDADTNMAGAHHRLVEVLIDLLDLATTQNCFAQTARLALAEALTPAMEQCRQEEARMEMAGLSGLAIHRQEHAAMLDRLAKASLRIDDPGTNAELLEFLYGWWFRHVWRREIDGQRDGRYDLDAEGRTGVW